MKRRKLTTEEAALLAEIAMQRAEKQERSRALPQQAYRDPSEFIKFERETMQKKMKRQGGYLNIDIGGTIVVCMIVAALIAAPLVWLAIEGVIWLLNHVQIGVNP